MNILVPLDDSKYSEKVFLHVCDMTKNYRSRLILLYVVEKTIPLNLLDGLDYLKMLQKVGNKVLMKGKNTTTQHM